MLIGIATAGTSKENLGVFQGNLLRGIDNCLSAAQSLKGDAITAYLFFKSSGQLFL